MPVSSIGGLILYQWPRSYFVSICRSHTVLEDMDLLQTVVYHVQVDV